MIQINRDKENPMKISYDEEVDALSIIFRENLKCKRTYDICRAFFYVP